MPPGKIKPPPRDEALNTGALSSAGRKEIAADIADFDLTCDVLVVGVGLAGACATLRCAEDEAIDVIAVDRAEGGGASALSGGVIYAAGTSVQESLGVEDSAEAMANYLRMETGDAITSATLRRFARASAGFLPWLTMHGALFGGPVTAAKTSYPGTSFLYYSGNENSLAGRELAPPAQRGHRAQPTNPKDVTQLSGTALMRPLLASIARCTNIRFLPQTRADRLILDPDGRVIGAEVLQLRGWRTVAHRRLWRMGLNQMLGVIGLLEPVRRAAIRLERGAERMRIRARRGVVLSAGGFTFNREMLAKTAPAYLGSMPLGTIADDGSGIELGIAAGGTTDRMGTVSAWRFLYPPAAWTKAVLIGPDGRRLINEELYGARTGEAIFERAGGKAWLILDSRLQAKVREEADSKELLTFQRLPLKLTLRRNTVRADTLADLAKRIGVPATALEATMASYNRSIVQGAPDALGKSDAARMILETAPYFATDVGAGTRMSPIPALTMGGLVVNEETGMVMDQAGLSINGLFAAGRTAVGICSNYYVSGLSLADCVWSGLRAAETLKGNGGARALDPGERTEIRDRSRPDAVARRDDKVRSGSVAS